VKKLGKGAAASALLLCHDGSDCRVLKVSNISKPVLKEQFERERVMLKRFESAGLGPKVFRIGKFKKGNTEYGVIEMERVSGTFDDILRKRQSRETLDWVVDSTDKIVKELCKYGLIHGDAHFGNFAYQDQPNGKRKPMLIDFGLACCKRKTRCDPRLEYITLIRDMPFEEAKIESHNLDYLMKRFIAIYRKRYNPELRDSEYDIEEEFSNLRHKYARKLHSNFDNPFGGSG
jgi:tRNA A-37 threonylcarbamoyl transferase component Bud32